MRAPVAPNGCPIDTEPPCTLTLSISGVPTASERPNRSVAHFLEPSASSTERVCAAKAS
ncbi:Uncharacterised protein [Mycobacteroides abscessus subsp. abscessus]|nr:Uncharacterised protein [Mycobacteroides abscessus subsp. abscessus]